MKITNYNEFKVECSNIKKYQYVSPKTTLWKKLVLEYIKQKYKPHHELCRNVMNHGPQETTGIWLNTQKKFISTVEWIEEYVEGLNDEERNNESFNIARKPINGEVSNIINISKYDFHDEIIKHALNKIRSKNYNGVINECCKAFETYIQKKSICDSTGTNLMGTVFNKKNPTLKITDKYSQQLSSQSNDDRQESIMYLSKGLICIRNILSHNTEIEYQLNENDMIEILFLINHLFKQSDKMTVKFAMAK